TEGVVRAMLLTKVKVVSAVVLGLALLGGGGGVVGYRTVAGEPGGAPQEPASRTPDRRAAQADEDRLKAQPEVKEKEFRDLRDRIKALEDSLREQTRQLKLAFNEQQQQAERAQVGEQEARKRAEAAEQE